MNPSDSLIAALQMEGYQVTSFYKSGGTADFYIGTTTKGVGSMHSLKSVLFKVSNSDANNRLLQNEGDLVHDIRDGFDQANPESILEGGRLADYFARLLESFPIVIDGDKRWTNVFEFDSTAVSLADIRDAYPDGIDPRDAAWMFNRLCEAMHLLHANDYVHAAILPNHFMVIPKTHEGFLIDFTFAVKTGKPAPGKHPDYSINYPSEVEADNPISFSTDIYMAALCFTHLTGYQVLPPQLKSVIKSCLLGRAHRIKYADDLSKSFRDALKLVYGPRKFRAFTMPSTTTIKNNTTMGQPIYDDPVIPSVAPATVPAEPAPVTPAPTPAPEAVATGDTTNDTDKVTS